MKREHYGGIGGFSYGGKVKVRSSIVFRERCSAVLRVFTKRESGFLTGEKRISIIDGSSRHGQGGRYGAEVTRENLSGNGGGGKTVSSNGKDRRGGWGTGR